MHVFCLSHTPPSIDCCEKTYSCKVTVSTTCQLLSFSVVVGHNFMSSFCLSFRKFTSIDVNTIIIMFTVRQLLIPVISKRQEARILSSLTAVYFLHNSHLYQIYYMTYLKILRCYFLTSLL